MTRNELADKIRKGTDIEFTIGDRGFTICDAEGAEGAKDITEWGRREPAEVFADAEALVDQYLIDGAPLGSLADRVIIRDYTLNGRE